MKRFIDSALKKWKVHPRRKPLILRGARQVGKTYSLKQFGEQYFSNTAIIDLERNPDWHRIFSGDIRAKKVCAELEVLLNQKIIPGKTLLFIDEIQACPRAVTALRYFLEEMSDLHVVAAGSLLEFALEDIAFPVGRIQFLNLHPLSFAEYLEATGREEAAQIVLGPPKALSQTVHEYLCEELRRYFFVGGMPECVKSYVDSGSVQEAFHVQAEICTTYRMDFSKYAPYADKHCLNAVLTSVAQRVGEQIKYARLAEGYTNPTLKKAFNLLSLANVIRRVPSADPSGLPLGATASGKIFKAVMVDIGLMQHLAGIPSDLEYRKADLMRMYQGALAEQFVGQEMVLSQQGNLYYWSRRAKSSTAEVDFLAVKDGNIFPVEVKSGPSGRLRSMHLVLERYPSCPGGIVLSSRPYSVLSKEKLTFIPLYFAWSATGGIRIS
jgi:predicted AAA+ superfamily ATPase